MRGTVLSFNRSISSRIDGSPVVHAVLVVTAVSQQQKENYVAYVIVLKQSTTNNGKIDDFQRRSTKSVPFLCATVERLDSYAICSLTNAEASKITADQRVNKSRFATHRFFVRSLNMAV